MTDEKKAPDIKWYYKPVWIVIALLAAGPFALPLVWLSPRIRNPYKIVISFLVIAATIWLANAFAVIYKDILKQAAELQSALQ
ncbi:MAG: hypothetical protein PHI58_07275 [Candidatus Omnitrophica bacterium]|nr:hypothetical protein [Candidatus Omnitrophota bacterium]